MCSLKKIETNDGSVTFHNYLYDETYHSVTGAVEEAVKKFVEPCRIKDVALGGTVKILDVCFGLGYNSACAIDAALENNPDCVIEVVGLEKDISILNEIINLNPQIKNYFLIKNLIKNNGRNADNKFNYCEGNVKIKLLIGNAEETIKDVGCDSGKFDAVFLDPFSPKKNPELWTEKFFSDIKKLMKQGAVLATYSCARIVRDNLKKAGFEVKDGPSVGRRAPSTIAINL